MNQICYISQCHSTNDEILKYLIPLKSDEVFTLYTFDQTQGRGQYGNDWKMFPNQNLAFSLAFHTSRISLPSCLFNFHTANVLRNFIAKKTEKVPEVKWPNDIILLGKKISGMLIERKKVGQGEFFIVGIGVNILQENFEHLPKAGSVLTQTSQVFDLKKWAEEMNNFFIQYLFKEISEEEVLKDFNTHLFRKNQISVFKIQGLRQNGIIHHITADGCLWVELEKDGLKKFFHKEIEMLY